MWDLWWNIWNKIWIEKAYYNCSWWEPFKCEICGKMFETKYKLRNHIKIVHEENLSNVRFVIKYLKQNVNWDSILKLFMMGTFQMWDLWQSIWSKM